MHDKTLGCAGESGVDQLVEIIKVLGTPTREEIYAMNPNYTEFKFPQIKAHPWSKVFSKRMPPDAVDLVSTCSHRMSATLTQCSHALMPLPGSVPAQDAVGLTDCAPLHACHTQSHPVHDDGARLV